MTSSERKKERATATRAGRIRRPRGGRRSAGDFFAFPLLSLLGRGVHEIFRRKTIEGKSKKKREERRSRRTVAGEKDKAKPAEKKERERAG